MNYRVKIGIEGSYLVQDHFDISVDGIESTKRLLHTLDWRDDKAMVIVFDDQASPTIKAAVQHPPSPPITSIKGFVIGEFPLGLGDHLAPFLHFQNLDSFLAYIERSPIRNSLIAIKGTSPGVLRLLSVLELKSAMSVLEIDIDRVLHNLMYYKSRLAPSTKTMAMLKAFAYGNGHVEIARILKDKVDYFGVAYTAEGIELRKQAIRTPIVVMNVCPGDLESLIQHNLEPSIAAPDMLHAIDCFVKTKGTRMQVHLKIDSGMNRLGFKEQSLPFLISTLKHQPNLVVKSIFSHLACADDETQDAFTLSQLNTFERVTTTISSQLPVRPAAHILNSSGIARFPNFQFDMVRLGIGLYGIDSHGGIQSDLKNISTLKTKITQIKKVVSGETVSYGRHHRVTAPEAEVAVIAIGYADGFNRLLSRGKGHVLVKNKRVPVVGNVCMDMAMIDVSGVSAKEGDEVTLFNDHLTVKEISSWLGTIPYEVLTGIGERVNREFIGHASW